MKNLYNRLMGYSNFSKLRFYILDGAILKPKCKVKYNHGNVVGKLPDCFINGEKSYGHMGGCLCENLSEDRCYK